MISEQPTSSTDITIDLQSLLEFLEDSAENLNQLGNLLLEFEKYDSDIEILGKILDSFFSMRDAAGFFQLVFFQKLAHSTGTILQMISKQEIPASSMVISTLISGLNGLKHIAETFKHERIEVRDTESFDQLLLKIDQLSQQKRGLREEAFISFNAFNALATHLPESLKGSNAFQKLEEQARHLGILVTDSLEKTAPNFIQSFHEFESGIPESTKNHRDFKILHNNIIRLNIVSQSASRTSNFRKSADFFFKDIDVSGEISTIRDILFRPSEEFLPVSTAQRMKDAVVCVKPKISGEALNIIRILELKLDQVVSGVQKFVPEFRTELKNIFQPALAHFSNVSSQSGVLKGHSITGTQTEHKTMRVAEEEIDGFMHFVGELVVVSDMFQYVSNAMSKTDVERELHERFKQANQTFNLLSQKMISSLLKIKLIPMEGLFIKLPGFARSVADKLGKQIDVAIRGGQIRIDKSIHDLLERPLFYLVAHAVEYGIESPMERRSKGKLLKGSVQIEAFSDEDDWVHFRISDDGNGISMAEIKHRVLETELVLSAELDRYTEEELQNCLLLSGFFTESSTLTDSLPDMGLSQIKQLIESANGYFFVETTPEKGTTFHIRMPASSSFLIIEGINTKVGNEEYILPMEFMKTAFQPKSGQVFTANHKEVIRYNNHMLRVVRLYEIFDTSSQCIKPEESILIVVEYRHHQFALMVDCLLGKAQVVVKDLQIDKMGDHLKHRGIAGGAIMGHGGVSLVLDVAELTRYLQD
ncbi:MAG: chemotaxis protein CheW [SAR324 cluster bacterium]|nr:chemotaxis protein CheW [SAR324 cluster bacterium]